MIHNIIIINTISIIFHAINILVTIIIIILVITIKKKKKNVTKNTANKIFFKAMK